MCERYFELKTIVLAHRLTAIIKSKFMEIVLKESNELRDLTLDIPQKTD